MNLRNPLIHSDTTDIRAAMLTWTLLESPEESADTIFDRSQNLIHALAEYRRNASHHSCPNWQDNLAFDMSVLKFRTEFTKHLVAIQSSQIQQVAFHIENEIDKARPQPLRDRFESFRSEGSDTETVSEFTQRVQPVLEMLDLYIENEFYPTSSSQNAWKECPYYSPEQHDAWFHTQAENSSEDSYLLHSIRGITSAINRRFEGAISDDESKSLRSISTEILQKTKLI